MRRPVPVTVSCLLALLMMSGIAVAATGPGTSPAGRAATASPAATWSGPDAIPEAMTRYGSPALAAYGGDLYAAWQGESSPYHIWYSDYDSATGSWSGQSTVPSALTNEYAGPALAAYGGDLYAAWEGQSSPYHIWYSAFNGTSWTAQQEVPSAEVAVEGAGANVGLAAYGGDLYLVWEGQSQDALWYSAFNGASWTTQQEVPGTGSVCSGAALASFKNQLYVAWDNGCPTNALEYTTFNGESWSSPASTGFTPNLSTAPALAVNGSDLYASWDAPETYTPVDVLWGSFNGTKWTGGKEVPGASTYVEAPAIASYNGALYDSWDTGASGEPSPIDYSVRS
jgi:hypothetical protein